MNGSKSPASGLEARIERIRQTMADQQARLARGSMLTASIGAILCVAMAIWFTIGYGMLRDMTTPKKIVEAAEAVVLESLPEYRKELEAYINEQADDWAAALSQQVQDNIPDVRSKMEDFIVKKADEALDHVQVVTADQFRAFVTDNSGMLRDGFTSLKKPDEAEQFVQDLHKAVETEMGRNMRDQSQEMLHMIYDLNAKLEKLKSGQKLNGEQSLEREILMIAKRLQEESQDDRPMKRIKKTTPRAAQDESETEAPAAKATDDADKNKEEPKTGDKETKAEKPADSSTKPDDGDKPAKENPEKKPNQEKTGEKENKAGDN